MVFKSKVGLALVVCAGLGCSDDGVVQSDQDTAGGTGGTSDGAASLSGGEDGDVSGAGESDTDAGGETGDDPSGDSGDEGSTSGGTQPPGMLPDPVAPSGVAYVAHFLSNDLRWYRTDGDAPTPGGVLDLGAATHDMALDAVHDRLVVAQDVAQRVAYYSLTRPPSPSDPVDDPELLSTVEIDTAPRFVRADPYHDRLYVLADDTRPATNMMRLHTVDVADPAMPIILSTVTVPASTSWDVDGPRRLLVLFHGQTDEIYAYDTTGDEPEAIGSPIDLRVPYPEENNTAFSPRNLTLDPWNARLYAGRSQGALSELIVMDYPAALPSEGQSYGDVADFALTPIDDPFDLSVDIGDRPGILDAFTPLPSPTEPLVFMTASAWNGTLPSATLVTMSGEGPLVLEPGCQDHEDFGCFIRQYADGVPGPFALTDGAACRDWTHGVVVTTALGSPEDEPGSVAFFQYEADGTTAPWLADGENLAASALPVAAVCH